MMHGYDVEVTFGDEVKRLRFDFNAMSNLEKEFGKGILAILKEEQIGFRVIRSLYHHGLKHGRDRGLTAEQTGKLLQEKMVREEIGMQELLEPIMQALEQSHVFGKDIEFGGETDKKNEATI